MCSSNSKAWWSNPLIIPKEFEDQTMDDDESEQEVKSETDSKASRSFSKQRQQRMSFCLDGVPDVITHHYSSPPKPATPARPARLSASLLKKPNTGSKPARHEETRSKALPSKSDTSTGVSTASESTDEALGSTRVATQDKHFLNKTSAVSPSIPVQSKPAKKSPSLSKVPPLIIGTANNVTTEKLSKALASRSCPRTATSGVRRRGVANQKLFIRKPRLHSPEKESGFCCGAIVIFSFVIFLTSATAFLCSTFWCDTPDKPTTNEELKDGLLIQVCRELRQLSFAPETKEKLNQALTTSQRLFVLIWQPFYLYCVLAGCLTASVVLIIHQGQDQPNKDELKLFVHRIIDVLKIHQRNLNPQSKPFLSVRYVEKLLMAPYDRKRFQKIWDAAICYIEKYNIECRVVMLNEGNIKAWRYVPSVYQHRAFCNRLLDKLREMPRICDSSGLAVRYVLDVTSVLWGEDWQQIFKLSIMDLHNIRILDIWFCEAGDVDKGMLRIKCASKKDAGKLLQFLEIWFLGLDVQIGSF